MPTLDTSELAVRNEVLVIIGAGGIGHAIARRQGPGKTVLLADFNPATMTTVAESLVAAGQRVQTQVVDVSSLESISALAHSADGLGDVVGVVLAAGVSPVQASTEAVLAVDLHGTAMVLEAFGEIIAPGGSGIVISSMAGHMMPALSAAQDDALANTPTAELLGLDFLSSDAIANSGAAYAMAKRANHLRVQAAANHWGQRGARLNSISPGIILTPLAHDEMSGPGSEGYRKMIEVCATGRVGTTDEVASAAAYLMGPDAAFVTGTDLLIDGGVISALRAHLWSFGT